MWCVDIENKTLSSKDGVVVKMEIGEQGVIKQQLSAPFYCSELKKNKLLIETRNFYQRIVG